MTIKKNSRNDSRAEKADRFIRPANRLSEKHIKNVLRSNNFGCMTHAELDDLGFAEEYDPWHDGEEE